MDIFDDRNYIRIVNEFLKLGFEDIVMVKIKVKVVIFFKYMY